MVDPIDPIKQSTPVVDNKPSNFKRSTKSVNNIQIFQTANKPVNQIGADETLYGDALQGAVTGDGAGNGIITLSPAEEAQLGTVPYVPPNPLLELNLSDITLPDGFSVSLSKDNGDGSYGDISITNDGQQYISVDVQIPDVNGIIDYEVRLIKK